MWLAPGTAGRVIVCERRGHWAVVLRRELKGADIPLRETRSLPECWDALAGHPTSFLVVELTPANAASLLERTARLERDYPFARIAVAAQRSLADWEWLVREAGAVHFTTSPRALQPLAAMIRRHLGRVRAPALPLAERLWRTLPWKGLKDEG